MHLRFWYGSSYRRVSLEDSSLITTQAVDRATSSYTVRPRHFDRTSVGRLLNVCKSRNNAKLQYDYIILYLDFSIWTGWLVLHVLCRLHPDLCVSSRNHILFSCGMLKPNFLATPST